MALLGFVGGAGTARAQSAEEIIKRNIKASGGEKALKAIQSVRMEGTVATAGGDRLFLWQTRKPDLIYVEIQAPQGAWIEAYNGRSGWRDDPEKGPHTLAASEQGRARANALFRNDRFLTYKKEKSKVQLLPRDAVDGRTVLVIEFTTRTGIQRRLSFDAQTYLLLKEDYLRADPASAGPGVREEIFYADYRAVDGVQEPHRITLRRGAETWDAHINKVTHNSVLDAQVFHFPARATSALPEIEALLKAVEQNQKNLEKLREDYTYTMVQTEYEVDGKGNVGQKSEKEYEVFYLGNWQIQKLVAEGGKPLPPDKAKKEEERIQKTIRDYQKAKTKEERERLKEEQRKAEGKANKKDEDDDDLTLSDILRICQFSNPRKERFRGQEVVVFEFDPRPGYKTRNRAESLIQKMTGVVWIDDNGKQIVRLEARLLENYKVGAGILGSLNKGSAFVFEQEKVRNEVWLPSYAEVNATARILFKGFKFNSVMRFSDYKKFNVESRVTVVPPNVPPDRL
jgi:hypothetical protein